MSNYTYEERKQMRVSGFLDDRRASTLRELSFSGLWLFIHHHDKALAERLDKWLEDGAPSDRSSWDYDEA